MGATKRGMPQTSGDEIIEVDEQGGVTVASEKAKRPRRKSGSAVSIGKDGAVFVRLPDDVAADYLATTERYAARGINPKVVEGAMLRAISAACAGKLEALSRADVMRALEAGPLAPASEGGGAA